MMAAKQAPWLFISSPKVAAVQSRGPAYEIAIGLDRDGAVRRFLQGRQAALAD